MPYNPGDLIQCIHNGKVMPAIYKVLSVKWGQVINRHLMEVYKVVDSQGNIHAIPASGPYEHLPDPALRYGSVGTSGYVLVSLQQAQANQQTAQTEANNWANVALRIQNGTL